MEEPIYDRKDALARIADDEELLQSLIDMFIDDASSYLGEIDSARAASDMPHLARAAHTIKGVLATFSAGPAHNAALALEVAAKHPEEGADLTDLIARLKHETERFLAAIAPA